MRSWRTDHRSDPVDHPRRRATGQPYRQVCRRRRRMTSSRTPAARRRAQWQNRGSGFRSLSMPVRSLLLPKTEASSRERMPWERSRPPSTTFRLQSESGPSWVAMSSAMTQARRTLEAALIQGAVRRATTKDTGNAQGTLARRRPALGKISTWAVRLLGAAGPGFAG